MMSRFPNTRYCLVVACLLLPSLGTSCPTETVLPVTPGVSVAGTYSGTVSNTTKVVTQLPTTGSTTTTGTGTLSFTLADDGEPLAVQVGFDNNGSSVSTFVIGYASLNQGVAEPFPAGSAEQGYTQTGAITAKEVSFSGTGFHFVIENTGSTTYLVGSQTGITEGGTTMSTFDGEVVGNTLTYTESVIADQTVTLSGALIGSSHTTIQVRGSLNKQ
jgi:hypothetical protein